MKKTLSLIAIAIAGMFAMNANAQTTENCEKCPHGLNAGQMNKMRQPREFTEFAFEGILLDIDQQSRIDSLNAAVKAQRPDVCPEGKQCDKAGKACPEGKQCDKAGKACPEGKQCDKAGKACPEGKQCDKAGDKKCNKACKDCKDCGKDCKDCKDCDKKCKDCKKCDKPCKDGKQCDKPCDKAGEQCKQSTQCDKGAQQCDKHGKGKGPQKMQPRRGGNPYGAEYVAKVQEILTPEQFVVFQENISKMPQMQGAPQDKAARHGKASEIRKKMEKGVKSNRPAKKAKN